MVTGLNHTVEPGELVHRCRFGAWAAGQSDVVTNHRTLEGLVGVELPVFSWFQGFHGWDATTTAGIAAINPAVPYDCMIALEAWGIRFAANLNGSMDDYFAEYFRGAATYPGRVIIRLFHEANGDWYPWGVAYNGDAVTGTDEWEAGVASDCRHCPQSRTECRIHVLHEHQ